MNHTEEALSAIVAAELRAWVPGASQCLIRRAADRMGVVAGIGYEDVTECTPDTHCLISDWVAGLYVLRCTTCDYLARY